MSALHICIFPLYLSPNRKLVLVPKQLEFQWKTACVLKSHCLIEVTCFKSVTYCIASRWWHLMQRSITVLTRLKQTRALYVSKALQLLHWYYSTKIAPKILQAQFLALAETPSEWNKREYRVLVSPLGEERSSSTVRTRARGCCGSALRGGTSTRVL